jgi:adenosylcobinamide amidohydrolase
VIEAGVARDGAPITGTGTDCIVVAAPDGEPRARYAGLHTAIGEAVGRCTCEAMRAGIEAWAEDVHRSGVPE